MENLVKELDVRQAKSVEDFKEGRILLIDKPLTWSSFDVVKKVRIMLRANLGIRKIKVGHAGTLDPLATGLLVLCIGKATKRINELMGLEKEYVAGITFGGVTPSYDLETEISQTFETGQITEEKVEQSLTDFLGIQTQTPPVFSAVRAEGRRGYQHARSGNGDVEMPSRIVEFFELELLSFNHPVATVRIKCSKGTYIRSLAHDLGLALNCGAYLSSLRRTANGNLKVNTAMSFDCFKDVLKEIRTNA
jgi:tRNA pseudouridine55 synthase